MRNHSFSHSQWETLPSSTKSVRQHSFLNKLITEEIPYTNPCHMLTGTCVGVTLSGLHFSYQSVKICNIPFSSHDILSTWSSLASLMKPIGTETVDCLRSSNITSSITFPLFHLERILPREVVLRTYITGKIAKDVTFDICLTFPQGSWAVHLAKNITPLCIPTTSKQEKPPNMGKRRNPNREIFHA